MISAHAMERVRTAKDRRPDGDAGTVRCASGLMASFALHGGLLAAIALFAWDSGVPLLGPLKIELIAPDPVLRQSDPYPDPPRPVRVVQLPAPVRQPVRVEKPIELPVVSETAPLPSEQPPIAVAPASEAPARPAPVPGPVASSQATVHPGARDAAAAPTREATGAESDGDAIARAVEARGSAAVPERSVAPAPGPITRTARPHGGYQVKPTYPLEARQARVEGTTLLRVHISEDGAINQITIERSAGHTALDRAATEAVRRWRFDPARSGATPVAVWVVIPVEFKLRNEF